jgi:eukaryotic-like serine/threonine-protein kinase
VYMFTYADARSPFAREATFGFRCMKAIDPIALPPAATQAMDPARDLNAERPVSDDVFRAYRSMYSYDRTPLMAHIDSADDSSADWRLERVSFAAAYGDERVVAYLFLPKHASPPYQVVVEFPGGNAIGHQRFEPNLDHDPFRFVVQSGRALMIPVYKGTYERRSAVANDIPNSTTVYRDHVIMWFKDLARSVDYLKTRPDVQHDQVGYVGISWGAAMGPIMLALEPRLTAAVLVGGGFTLQRSLPEADAFNFAPRVATPVLMLNGRFDFVLSPTRSQEPMFRLLGSAGALKRRIVFESGHYPPHADIVRETLDWLDRYLGPSR